MENEAIDDFGKPEKKGSTVTRNVLVGMTSVLVISIVVGVIIGSGSGAYAVLGGLIAGCVTFPVLTVVLSISFFLAKKSKEGGITLLVGLVVLLFGVIVCGGFFA